MFKLLEKNKKELINTIYSNELLISKYFEFMQIDYFFDNDLIMDEILTSLDKSLFISINKNNYSIHTLPKINSIYLNNYVERNYLNKIEEFYNINNYCLKVSNLFILDTNKEKEKENDEKIIEISNYNNQFLLIINLENITENLINFELIPNYENILNKNSAIVICNNLKYKINNVNTKLLIFSINVLDGYNKIDNHNSHPNIKFLKKNK
jgi:hypothetical protein